MEKGADVVIVGRSAEKLARAATERGGGRENLQTIVANASEENKVVNLFDSVGAFDHLVTTTADLAYQSVRELDLTALRKSIDSKIVAAFLLAKYGSVKARANGSLTFTSGIAAFRPSPKGAMTEAVNGAINSLVKALALELAPTRVNAVFSGLG